MTTTSVPYRIETIEQIREIIQRPPDDSGAWKKDIGYIDEFARDFILKSPFAMLATSSKDGRCDVTPRGDAPGFIKVLDEHHLAIPDRPGNNRIDSLENILENPHAGLVLMVPPVDETLRINGKARITADPELLESMAMQGKVPKLAIVVEVEELYFHCARAFKRGKVWQPDTWIDRSEVPTLGQILHAQLKREDITAEQYDAGLEEAYRRLY